MGGNVPGVFHMTGNDGQPQLAQQAQGPAHVNQRFRMQDGSAPTASSALPGLGPSGYQFHGGQHDYGDPRAVLERAGMDYNRENLGQYNDWRAQTEATQNQWRAGAANDPNVQAQRASAGAEAAAMTQAIPGFGQNGNWGSFDQRVAAAGTVGHPTGAQLQAAAIRNQPLDAGGGQAAATNIALNRSPGGGAANADPAAMAAIAARNAAQSQAGRVGGAPPQTDAANTNTAISLTNPLASTDASPRRVTRLQRRR